MVIMNPNHEQQLGAYVNSLTPATNMSLASNRGSHQPSSSQLPSAEEASRMLFATIFLSAQTYL